MDKREAWEVFDGLMLGDGNLTRYPSTAGYQMAQSKHTISIEDHLKWLCWLKDNVFASLGISAVVKQGLRIYSAGAKKGQKYQLARLWTEFTLLLARPYDEWYTGGGWVARKAYSHLPGGRYIHGATKVVPKRLMDVLYLPTHSLALWFLGDGGSSWSRKDCPTPTVHVSLSTYGFSEEEVYHLTDMLNNRRIETVKPARVPHNRGSGLRIRLSQNSVDSLMHLVEPLILEIFGSSEAQSYRNMIKYKSAGQVREQAIVEEFDGLRQKLSKS